MAEVTDVDITSGVPTGGTGTVPTLSKTNTLAGAVNETAPASDTASSGLNGRLQRIAQRITSMIALLPTALGANGGLKIEGVASGTVVPVTGTITAVTALTNALPAGANAIGKLAANSGVDIGDVDVTTVGTITPGTAATSLGKAVDAAAGSTDTGIAVLAIRDDALSTLTPVEGDYAPHRLNANGAMWVAIDSSTVNANGGATAANSAPVVNADQYGAYETVAASQTAQALGATGATGDYLAGVLVFPGTAGCGVVTILDNATTIGTFAGGGTTALPSLVPFMIPVGLFSVSGAWKITTGANVTAVGVGKFT